MIDAGTVETNMIDLIDREIIRILQSDGRMSYRDIGDAVGLSANATGVRVTRLIADGVISGVHATVNQEAIGRPIEAYVDCWMENRDAQHWEEFAAYIKTDDRVLDAVHLTGKVDHRLRVAVASPADLDAFLMALKEHGAIAETDTRLILRRHSVRES
jgi:Lrp/AsnC family leucine-responsive transcriptional regulator